MKIFRKGFALSALIFATAAINAQEIRFVMSGTSFKVADLQGTNITVTGIDAGQSVNIGASVNQTYTAPNGATVVFRGDITRLNITAGTIASADLSVAPSTLTVFTLNNTGTSSINLSGATNLTGLSLRNQAFTTLDLSAQTKVTTLYLGRLGEAGSWTLNSVTLPTTNAITTLDITNTAIRTIDLNNLPLLKDFRANGSSISDPILTNSPLIERIELRRCSSVKSLVLHNRTNLKTVLLNESGVENVEIVNSPLLKEGTNVGNYGTMSGFVATEGGVNNLKSLTLSGCGFTKFDTSFYTNLSSLTKLDLSNNTALATLDVSKLTTLTNLNVSNTALSSAVLSDVINALPTVKQSDAAMLFTTATLTDAVKTLLDSKGWGLNGTPTDIHSSQVGGAKATVSGSTLQVTGIKANAGVKVYAISGVQVANGQTNADGNVSVELAGCTAGTYVVVADGFSQRIVVR